MEPGWHPDPSGKFEQRYYDGATWTDHVARGGEMMRDHPVVPPTLPPPPTVASAGRPRWVRWALIGGAVILVLAVIGALAGGDDDDKTVTVAAATSTTAASSSTVPLATAAPTSTTRPAPTTPKEEQRYGAFDVCTKFVKDRLKAPSTAKFRNFFEKDGEVVVTSADGVTFVVTSSVDSQNSFGAMLRTNFVCTVLNTGGTNWRLVDLTGI